MALVPPDAGRRYLVDEIRFGDPSEQIVAALGRLVAEEPAAVPVPVLAAREFPR